MTYFTFSQMVDGMVSELKRPDLSSEIATYVNQTVREMHFTEDRNAALFFRENFNELLLTSNLESGLVWEIPSPTVFQKLTGVQYLNVFDDDGQPVWPRETTPGRHLQGMTQFFYRVGSTYVFSGYGGLNSQIALGWYEFPRSLKYKTVAARPASFDIESGWTYDPSITTPEQQEAARILSTNWIIQRWNDVVEEGVRAKVYKRVGDTERARTCYSLYQSLRHGFWTSETAEF